MKLSTLIFVFNSILLSSCYERALDEPSYDELSSIVTTKGKVLNGDVTITVPEGAIQNDILVKYKSESIDRSSQTLPPAIITDDDNLVWQYDQTIEVWPQDITFLKPVTLEFRSLIILPGPVRVYELKAGTDGKNATSWSEVEGVVVTSDLGNDDTVINFSTDHFGKYLITYDQEQDRFIMDYGVPTISVPYGWIKPRLVANGKYRATILDLAGGFYLLNVDFINQPVNNTSYNIFDAFYAGSFLNTSNLFAEVEANFNCTVTSSVSCTQKFYCKSGEIKYSIDASTSVHKILFKNVVVKSLTSGNEHYLNGSYILQ